MSSSYKTLIFLQRFNDPADVDAPSSFPTIELDVVVVVVALIDLLSVTLFVFFVTSLLFTLVVVLIVAEEFSPNLISQSSELIVLSTLSIVSSIESPSLPFNIVVVVFDNLLFGPFTHLLLDSKDTLGFSAFHTALPSVHGEEDTDFTTLFMVSSTESLLEREEEVFTPEEGEEDEGDEEEEEEVEATLLAADDFLLPKPFLLLLSEATARFLACWERCVFILL